MSSLASLPGGSGVSLVERRVSGTGSWARASEVGWGAWYSRGGPVLQRVPPHRVLRLGPEQGHRVRGDRHQAPAAAPTKCPRTSSPFSPLTPARPGRPCRQRAGVREAQVGVGGYPRVAGTGGDTLGLLPLPTLTGSPLGPFSPGAPLRPASPCGRRKGSIAEGPVEAPGIPSTSIGTTTHLLAIHSRHTVSAVLARHALGTKHPEAWAGMPGRVGTGWSEGAKSLPATVGILGYFPAGPRGLGVGTV